LGRQPGFPIRSNQPCPRWMFPSGRRLAVTATRHMLPSTESQS